MAKIKIPEKLSDRIVQRMSHCKRCGGTLTYFKPDDPTKTEYACMDCCDWNVVRKGVKELEDRLEEME